MQIQALQIVTKLLGLSGGAAFVTFLMQKDFTFNVNIFLKGLYINLMLFLQTALKSSIVSTFRLAHYTMAVCSLTI